jgi:LacI family transcriptional regulator
MLIGMIIPDQTNPFFAELSAHLQVQLAQVGVPLVVLSSDNDAEEELKCMQALDRLNVSGIVFVSAGDDIRIHDILKTINKPHIIIDREIPDTAHCDFVLTDNPMGIELAVQHLVSSGHRSLAFIKGSQSTDPGRNRLWAFQATTQKLGLDSSQQYEFDGKFDFQSGYEAAKSVIAMARDARPTAVVASNDLEAIGALQCFQENSIRVPDDISLVGFDDITLCRWCFPRLTSVRQDTIELTRFAAQLLLSRLSGEHNGEPRLRHVIPKLVIRQSTRSIE